MKVSVAYVGEFAQSWLQLDVADDCTVEAAISASGLLDQYPELNLKTTRVGVFGKLTKLDQTLSQGDRVELYRPLQRALDDDDDDDDD